MASIKTKDNFDSISESCFLVLPNTNEINITKNKRKRTKRVSSNSIKRRTTQDAKALKHDGFQQMFNGLESEECMILRKNNYHSLWDKTEQLMNDVLLDSNHAVRENIRQFVDTSDDMNSNSLISMPYFEIPTALVFAGINTPDHNTQFNEISNTLKERQPNRHYVALLEAQNCQSIKHLMSSMMEQLIEENHMDVVLSNNNKNSTSSDIHMLNNNDGNRDDDKNIIQENHETIAEIETVGLNDNADEDEEINDGGIENALFQFESSSAMMTTKPTKLPNYDLQILVGWYMEAVKQLPKQQWPKIVIILQDFESFEPHVLQDFIAIMSEYRATLPVVFIIGIATSTEILHQSLDKSTLSLLRIEKFWLQQSDVWFNRVLDSLFIDSNFTLKFGARPFKFLLDHFYLYDFSISKVKSSIKYALMHHFYGNPLSIFIQLYGSPSKMISTTLKQWYQDNIINEHHAAHIRMLRSFRDYIESISETNPGLALKSLDEDEYLLTKQLPIWISGLEDYQKEFKRGVALLQLLQSQFPAFTNLKKKTKRLIYLELLENANWEQQSDTLHWLINLVRKLSPTDLDPFLEKLRLKLLEDNNESNAALAYEIKEIQFKLQSIVQSNADEISKMKRKEKKLEGLIIEQDYTDTTGGNSRQTKTAEKVQENAIAQLKLKGSLISKLAFDVADWFRERFKHDLRSYTKLPMHELIYYNHVRLHEKSFAPQIRGAIQSALTLPQYYLNCDCCDQDKNEEYSILSSEHDTCLLYKLYLECGRMINLYDWFVAFSCIIEREPRPENHPLNENEVQLSINIIIIINTN
ncbi:unnamed protein product [Cunninghamella blakesleeana]